MSRPRYETQADLDNEQMVVEAMDLRGYKLEKLPLQYRMDFAIFKQGKCLGFAEVKTRRVNVNAYPSVMISLSKVLAAQWITNVTGLPSYLIIQYQDAITRLDLGGEFEIRMGGRADRGDPQDRDICAFFPTESLMLISKK